MLNLPEEVYISFVVLLLSFSLFLVYKLYKFSLLILNMESAIEECLDLLNEKYETMYDLLQKPIFFDSVEIRQMVADLKESHDAVLIVANKLTMGKGLTSEIEKENTANEITDN